MSNTKKDIKNSIAKLATGSNKELRFVIGKVVKGSVNGCACDVQPLDGALLKKVRLNADIDNSKGFNIIPSDDSFVVVSMLSNIDSFVSMYSNIEKWEYKDDHGAEMVIENGKISVKNKQTDLFHQIDKLLKGLINAVIATPSGSGKFDANTIKEITEVQINLSKLLQNG